MDKKISEKPSISGGATGVIHVGSHPAGVTKKGLAITHSFLVLSK